MEETNVRVHNCNRSKKIHIIKKETVYGKFVPGWYMLKEDDEGHGGSVLRTISKIEFCPFCGQKL